MVLLVMARRERNAGLRAVVAMGLLFLVSACQKTDSETKPQTSAVASTSKPAPEPPEPPPPWFVGVWQGEVNLVAHPPSLLADSEERLRARKGKKYKEPSQPAAVEEKPFKIEISITEDGKAHGEGSFASDALTLVGLLDEETLRLRLKGTGSHGVLVARREGDRFTGQLRLGHVERQGALEKTKGFEGSLVLELHK